jgi:valyl-tRNA synthetase
MILILILLLIMILILIPNWGTLTVLICSYDVKSQQMNLDLSLVKSAGAWCNKIWQVSRFLLMAHQKVAQGPYTETIDL